MLYSVKEAAIAIMQTFRLVGITYDQPSLEKSYNPTEHYVPNFDAPYRKHNCLFIWKKLIKILLYNVITKLIILKIIVFFIKNMSNNYNNKNIKY